MKIILRRATEPFFTTKEPGRGTGLGLSMVHDDRAARWACAYQQQTGHDSRVVAPRLGVTLAESDLTLLEAAKPSSENLVIVVVDDDRWVLANTVTMLEDKGHCVLEASSGAQALDLIRKSGKIDIVITDHAMPK